MYLIIQDYNVLMYPNDYKKNKNGNIEISKKNCE